MILNIFTKIQELPSGAFPLICLVTGFLAGYIAGKSATLKFGIGAFKGSMEGVGFFCFFGGIIVAIIALFKIWYIGIVSFIVFIIFQSIGSKVGLKQMY